MHSRWAVFALALFCAAAEKPENFNSIQRLDDSHLQGVRQARLEWSRTRVVRPPIGLYRDFRAILDVPAATEDEREEVLKAAKEAGVNIVVWTGKDQPDPAAWDGYRHGVLFVAGKRDGNTLRFPSESGELKFLAQPEPLPDMSLDGFAGMEIDHRRGSKAQLQLADHLREAAKHAGKWRAIVSRQHEYPDVVYAAGSKPSETLLARYDQEIARRRFTAIAGSDAGQDEVVNRVLFNPYDVAFRALSTHVLAREIDAGQVRESLRDGHAYVAHDWLCDPAGFSYVASNNFGVYDMGDRVPRLPNTKLFARFPVSAGIKLIHNASVVAETTGVEFTFTPKEDGAYRLEAWLKLPGEERPWIYSNPLYLYTPDPSELALPPSTIAGNVKPLHDIEYAEGKPEDAGKHKLDLYLPLDKKDFPVIFFVHGGSWRTGDRSSYVSLGNRFAKLGIGVVIPSYRLAPANPHPAQIEDVAAAFAWTVNHIQEYGGDPKRIFAAGHSAGGHLVSLLALDPRYLAKFDLTPKAIGAVISLSGVYDVGQVAVFGPDERSRRLASPLEYVNAEAPPFLIAYCQWDYPGLPAQAQAFDRALRRKFVTSTLRFIPNENHISEIVHLWKDDDPTAREILKFIDESTR